MRMLLHICILIFCVLSSHNHATQATIFNLTLALPLQPHPFPDDVAHQVLSRVKESTSRRQMLSSSQACLSGNPIDDCWRCDPNWQSDRQRLADCSIGFGRAALGGKGGQTYVVTDPSDSDPADPSPGTLRHAAIQEEPLWITFATDMVIKLKHELLLNSFKTIDGRGANVQVTGNGCITLHYISNVIIHSIHVYGCRPSGNARIRSSPGHVGLRDKSDGDGISIFGSRDVWIDHCSLSQCADGLVDAIRGTTGVTISNSYFSRHDKVMLLGHDDRYQEDKGMQVTIAFNHFGEELVQRMPRCRHGYIHVVNNDYTQWEMYAIGGSASPTINSQGNRYTAPTNHNAKEVTKRVDTDEGEWEDWKWRTEGDIMVNGAFFVPSGEGASAEYDKASSLDAKSGVLIDQLTSNAGVIGDPRDNNQGVAGYGSGGGGDSGGGDYFGMIFGSDAPPLQSAVASIVLIILALCLSSI